MQALAPCIHKGLEVQWIRNFVSNYYPYFFYFEDFNKPLRCLGEQCLPEFWMLAWHGFWHVDNTYHSGTFCDVQVAAQCIHFVFVVVSDLSDMAEVTSGTC